MSAKTKARKRQSVSSRTKVAEPEADIVIAFTTNKTNESKSKISEITPLRFCLFFRMFIVCPPCVSSIVPHSVRSLQGERGRFRSKQSKRFNFQRLSEFFRLFKRTEEERDEVLAAARNEIIRQVGYVARYVVFPRRLF